MLLEQPRTMQGRISKAREIIPQVSNWEECLKEKGHSGDGPRWLFCDMSFKKVLVDLMAGFSEFHWGFHFVKNILEMSLQPLKLSGSFETGGTGGLASSGTQGL